MLSIRGNHPVWLLSPELACLLLYAQNDRGWDNEWGQTTYSRLPLPSAQLPSSR